MENICLIRRKDTLEWYCLNFAGYYGFTYGGEPFGVFPDKKNDWSKDENEAMRFNDRQQAERFIEDMEYLHDVLSADCEIIEK